MTNKNMNNDICANTNNSKKINNDLTTRVSRLEQFAVKVQENNNVLANFVSEISGIIVDTVTEQVKEEFNANKEEMENNILDTVTNGIDDKVRDAVHERGLTGNEERKITTATRACVRNKLGNSKSDKYILFAPFLFGALKNSCCKKFGIRAYNHIEVDRLNELLDYINNFVFFDSVFEYGKRKLDEDYFSGVLDVENVSTRRRKIAYERAFPRKVKERMEFEKQKNEFEG